MILAIALLAAQVDTSGVFDGEPGSAGWRKVATVADRARLRDWRAAWLEALGPGHAAPATGGLSEPDAALPGAAPPAGRYRCRITRLGPIDPRVTVGRTGAWRACAVGEEGGARTFAISGEQRIAGRVFADTESRQVFLGTLALADESRMMRYGRDARRDVAGIVERVGERRWRMVLPRPSFGSTIDLMEIEPVG